MSEFKPGEFRITNKAMEKWQLPEGSKVLDMGCGRGDTLNHLKEKFGFIGTGLELSLKMIEEGKECVDIVTQLSAVRSSLDRAISLIVAENLVECVQGNSKEGSTGEENIQQAIQLLMKSR